MTIAAKITTTINSNGSRWAGQKPLGISALLSVLAAHTLNPLLAPFITRSETTDCVQFSGNFVAISHVFNIHTNDPEIIETITKAINQNMQRADYLLLLEPLTETSEI